MTRRNNKRSNRRNRQRNNKTELSQFASMLFGALLGKSAEMIEDKMAEAKKTTDIHIEGITNNDINNINNGNATLSKLSIPSDGSAVEYPVPDNLQFFFAEDGKLMVRKKIEGDENPTNDDKEGKPITYDDICKKLFLEKTAYWVYDKGYINKGKQSIRSYTDSVNCTSEAQAKRLAAFNKLQNIAKYLNKGWKPDFRSFEKKWCIGKDGKSLTAKYNLLMNEASIYFKSKDLVSEAILLMGKESLNDLFSTDW